MKVPLVAACAALAATLTLAQDAPAVDAVNAVEAWQEDPMTIFQATEIDIDDFRYVARPVVVFSDTPANPAFGRQVDLIRNRISALAERDVVVVLDAEPDARSELRQRLRPRGFGLVLMNKDGSVALRKPSPWDVREITRSIDKTPERQQELREQRRQPLTD
ncbi:DUF4174 domain-containing protein [Roseitranquillus sediminis]|uniref:DUF4174 domain-containing protein n=1 Tax=Roseitranquillus sediminis TaxID=2809051 RepID=UPI001D0C7933|nr:DUF4174 domain-containing protein [Roseitranquillus sediminis]MBM9594157.1 DUF4174 domain-containing protein [Roseitranquillus sediminis]